MKQKLSNLFIVIIFIAMITVPQIVWWGIGGSSEDVATTENRKLRTKPELKLETITNYPKAFDSYYNDQLPFRSKLIKAWASINYDLFGSTIDSRVVIGKDGWLFYRGDISIQQAQGISEYTDKEKNEILQNLKFNQDKLKEKGIEYYALVIPNKENVYKEYLPDTIPIKEEASRTEKLIDYIRENSYVNIVYPKEELLQAKEKYQVYKKCDTHWNDIGALVGTIALQKEIDSDFSYDINNIEIQNLGEIGGDLVNFASLSGKLDEENIRVNNFYPEISYERKEKERFISNSENDKKVLFIGDSFREAMRTYFSKLYGEVVYVHRDNYKEELLDEIEPDIVIYEAVERYSDFLIEKLIRE